MLFAVTMSVMLYAIYKRTQLKYDRARTAPNLTLVPFYAIIGYLVLELAEILLVLY